MTLTLYFLENSRAFRVAWLLYELGLQFELKTYPRINGKKAPAELSKDSGYALGKSPALRDTDGDVLVTESGACVQYILDRYGSNSALVPSSSSWQERADINMWTSFSEGTLMLHSLAIMYTRWFIRPEDESNGALSALENGMSGNVKNDLDFLESSLAKNAAGQNSDTPLFLVGNKLTAADIMMVFSAEYVLNRKTGTEGSSWPHVEKWLRGLEARPAYKKAQEAGHEFSLL